MNKILRDELLQHMKADQEMRFKGTMDQSIDLRNTAWLKKVLKQHGWPDIKMVGKKGSIAAWILAQHADHDPEFQYHCLELMTKSYLQGNIEPEYFALLTDRVRVNQGKKQIYGTQNYRRRDGILYSRPILNMKKLPRLRKQMGLPPLAEYLADHRMLDEKLKKKGLPTGTAAKKK